MSVSLRFLAALLPAMLLSGNEYASAADDSNSLRFEDCVRRSWNSDSGISQQRAIIISKQAELRKMRSRHLARVTSGATYRVDNESRFQEGFVTASRNYLTGGIYVSQPIWTSGLIRNDIGYADACLHQAEWKLIELQCAAATEIADLYYGFQKAKRCGQILKDIYSQCEEIIPAIRLRHKSGLIKAWDLMEVEHALFKINERILGYSNNEMQCLRVLREKLKLDEKNDLHIESGFANPPAMNQQDIEWQSNNPSLKMLEEAINEKEYLLDSSKAGRWPNIYMDLYMIRHGPRLPLTEYILGGQLTFTMPIATWGYRSADIDANASLRVAAQADFERVRAEIGRDVSKNESSLADEYRRWIWAHERSEDMHMAIREANEYFKSGLIEPDKYINALTICIEIVLTEIESYYQFHIESIRGRSYLGKIFLEGFD